MEEWVPTTPLQHLYAAITNGDLAQVKHWIKSHPELLHEDPGTAASWLDFSAGTGHVPIVKFFIDAGLEVNLLSASGTTALSFAIDDGHLEVARCLLEHGADPNIDRSLISALNSTTNRLEMVQLLVEHGADVNQTWRFGDEETGKLFNALSWAGDHQPEIAAYLRSQGAVMPPQEEPRQSLDPAQRIVPYLVDLFGSVDKRVIRTIVPEGQDEILIHRIAPTSYRNSAILFTTGMSKRPMQVPQGQEKFQYAELLMELPGDWPITRQSLGDNRYRWPLEWLRRIAHYPHQAQTWLGGLYSIIVKSEPPQPFAAGCPFSAMMVVAGYDEIGPVETGVGVSVNLYTLIPLYAEERQLEKREGLPALFRRLDTFQVGRAVDVHRKNVALDA